MNRYNLDAKLTQSQEVDFWDQAADNTRRAASRIQEYWNVRESNKGLIYARKN